MPTRPPTVAILEFPAEDSSSVGKYDSFLLAGVIAVLIFSVLAFGGAQEWAVFGIEAACAVLFVTWSVAQATAGSVDIPDNVLLLPMALFALLVTVQLVLRSTVYLYATRMEAMRYAAYGILFLVAQHCFRRRRYRLRFLYALSVFGCLLSVLAVLQDFTAGGKIYWHWPVPNGGTIYGPYANHANYAGLMEMLAPLPLALALSRTRSLAQRVLLVFFAVFMAATIFFSRSRGGMVAFVAETAFLLPYLWFRYRGNNRTLKLLLPLGILALVVVLFAPAKLADQIRSLRMPLNPQSNGDRITIAGDTLRMFRARPVVGWGLDVFPIVYPRFRSFATVYFINEAHNDYVQLLAETGLLGFGSMVIFVVFFYRAALRNASEDSVWGSSVVALAGCTGLLVHGLFDFNMHIPANAAMFFVLTALATTKSNPWHGSPHIRVGAASRFRRRRYDDERDDTGYLAPS